MSTLGQQLKQLRNDKKLSQPEFAEQAGIEQSYLSKLENDKSIPSNEIFRSLLIALDLSIDKFMEPLVSSHDKARLIQIPDVEQWYKNKTVKNSATQRKFIYLAMFLISIGCALFYSGYKNDVFNENFYEYKSFGVVRADEPQDIFENWRDYTLFIPGKSNASKEGRYEMQVRRKELYKLMGEYVGESFVEKVEGGKRVYLLVKVEPHTLEHMGNSWLEFLGLFAAVFGLVLSVLQPRLTSCQ